MSKNYAPVSILEALQKGQRLLKLPMIYIPNNHRILRNNISLRHCINWFMDIIQRHHFCIKINQTCANTKIGTSPRYHFGISPCARDDILSSFSWFEIFVNPISFSFTQGGQSITTLGGPNS